MDKQVTFSLAPTRKIPSGQDDRVASQTTGFAPSCLLADSVTALNNGQHHCNPLGRSKRECEVLYLKEIPLYC